ncbi:PLP-dependent cysteine synthase family protein [Humibacter ginsenosidimutans]|uniref:Pyridoxal-phosphate dependent enzyme n=1 Tax=Humibacter ginsenosidimutans TaxID=2599293 RepID=A0A5B8M6S1_9MICO|nr:pyridoxal-phosphate dependent enzyme [Humibacter ginsenosidimutans]QDZ15292.1 pyridoxal-phosphate dependent enzyme [Humibacter ginsenosidimutans]
MTRYETLADAVGATPLIRLTRLAADEHGPRVYVKLEAANPAGTVKDRAALSILRAARADGSLPPGGVVVTTATGDTGIGVAALGAHLGHRVIVFAHASSPAAWQSLLHAYGAEVRLLDAPPQELARLASQHANDTADAWLLADADDPAGAAAHAETTGPEIWTDTDGAVTHLVAAIGTGALLSGAGAYLKRVSNGRVVVVGADTLSSSYSGGDGSRTYIEGVGRVVPAGDLDERWPGNLDASVIDSCIAVDDRTAIATVRALAAREGILAGGSSGVALAAALELAGGLSSDDVVVVVLPDSGRRDPGAYFDDGWMLANGFVDDDTSGVTLRSLVPRARTLLVQRDASPHAALDGLTKAGAAASDPALVVEPRERALAPHPEDVVGWTTIAALRAAIADEVRRADAGLAEPDGAGRSEPVEPVADADSLTVAHLSFPRPPAVGIGLTAVAALAAARADQPAWSAVLVLDDGRVAGVLTRAELEGHARASGARLSEAIDGFVELEA